MNTPKYGCNPIRNTLSPSPLRNSSKGKYFSAQQVTKLVKTSFQPKIQFLMQQIEDRQQIIAQLNNKLNENDEKLRHQTSIIENHLKKQRDNPQMQSYVVSTINQLINDKTKQCWQTIGAQLKQIAAKMKQQSDPRKTEAIVQQEMQKLKGSVVEFIESYKKKSNSYWLKIKDALNKINSKMVGTEKDIMDINVKIQNFQQQRARDRQTIMQLQNSKNVVKNMIQLKKSVENIYQNYQAVLNLQKNLRQKLEDQHGDSLWHQPQYFRSNSKMTLQGEDLMALQYSKQQGNPIGESQGFGEWKPYENMTQPIVSPIKNNNLNDKSSNQIFQLQKTTPFKNQQPSQLFSLNTSNQVNSKIHNSTFLLNHSLQTRKDMCNDVRQRLLDLIQIKSLMRPLEVRLDDQINCLKTADGNYLFDAKGNMFKLRLPDLIKLEEQGIITRNKVKKTSLSHSKFKKSVL